MMSHLYDLGMDFLNISFDDAFSNIKIFFLAYVLALSVFWIRKRDDLKSVFVYPVLFALFTVFNPYLMIPLADKIGLSTRIRRIFWLLPVNLVLAFMIVCLLQRLSKNWKRAVTALVLLLLIAVVGENQYKYMIPAENVYKIKDESIAIADLIEADAGTTEPKSCLFADLQLLELRQYDPSIVNTIRRKDMLDWSMDPGDPASIQQVLDEKDSRHILTMVLYYGVPVEAAVVEKYMKKYDIAYVIPNKDKMLDAYFQGMGYEMIGETEHYAVFRVFY